MGNVGTWWAAAAVSPELCFLPLLIRVLDLVPGLPV